MKELRQPRRIGLTWRLLAAMVVVALVAFAAVALATAPYLRDSVERSARTTVARQAELLSQLPQALLITLRLDSNADVRGLNLGVVTADGRKRAAARQLTDAQVRRLLAGRAVSATTRSGESQVLVEARPVNAGGAVVVASQAGSLDREVAAQRRRLIFAFVLGLAVAVIAAALTASYVVRPLTRVAAVARRMGAGERGATPPRSGIREVAVVADALHQLDVDLAGSEDRQRRFLLSVSHELRTPLTAVRGYAESLQDGVVTPEEIPEVATTMVAESERLERYVADLLALARLEADDFDLRPAELDAVELVQAASAAWQDRANRADITVRADVLAGTLPLVSDPTRVRQVLDALVDNAVRVCPSGSTVIVAASPHRGGVRFEVRDSGPGLSAEDAAVAFVPGELRERYAGTRPTGHGLGLALVHRLVTRLGGNIHLEKAQEGGAAFVIDLPPEHVLAE